MASKGRTSKTSAGAGSTSSGSSGSSGSKGASSSSGSKGASSSAGSKGASSSGTSRGSSSRGGTSKPSSTPSNVSSIQNQPSPSNRGIVTNASNAPYAATQSTSAKTVGATQVRGNKVQGNPQAAPQQFTYATNKSGNTFVIPSQLSKQAVQAYAKLGVVTSNTPPTQTNMQNSSNIDVIVDPTLADWQNPYAIPLYDQPPTEKETQPPDKYFQDNPKYEDKQDNPIANDVTFSANCNVLTTEGMMNICHGNVNTEKADENWAMGENFYNANSDAFSVLSEKDQADYLQWLTQRNQEIVPTTNYDAFSANGKSKTGSAALDAGFDNLKGSFGNIFGSKWMPFIILGIVGIIVLSFLKPKAAAGAGAGSGTKVIIT